MVINIFVAITCAPLNYKNKKMPESKFLKHQDKNNDGLIDVCEALVPEASIDNCLPCSPNPDAILPDWKTLTIDEPFFNEKNCTYQITVVTSLKSIFQESPYEATSATEEQGQEAIDDVFEKYKEDAIEALLVAFEKVDNETSRAALQSDFENTDYYLDPRPKSPLLLLYSVPFETFYELENADGPTEDEEAEEDAAAAEEGRREVTYKAAELAPKLMKIRKGLALYNIYLKKYQALDKGNLFFEENPDTIFNLSIYGDFGGGRKCVTAKLLKQLEAFLNLKGYEIPGVGRPHIFRGYNDVTKITFSFDTKYKLKKLLVYTKECGEVPRTFIKSCRNLRGRSAWKDPTAVAYFTRLDEMEADLTARTPKPWLDFVIEYTYPKIYSSINHSVENIGDVESCVAAALRNEVKQLGQNILDDVFDIGDAIAFKFSETCYPPGKRGQEKYFEEQVALGMISDPNAPAGGNDKSDSFKNIYNMALTQANKEVENEKNIFTKFCLALETLEAESAEGPRSTIAKAAAAAKAKGTAAESAQETEATEAEATEEKPTAAGVGERLKKLFTSQDALGDLKLCGLQSLLIGAIQCLFKGMTLEAALGTMLNQALKAMSVQNFDRLFIGLPYEKQVELDALVKKKLANGDIFKDDSTNQKLSDAAAGMDTSEVVGHAEFRWPWQAYRKADSKIDKNTTLDEFVKGKVSENDRRPLAQQFDIGSEDKRKQLSNNILMQAYIEALLEVYQENLLELVSEFNKFPGAPLIKFLITTFDCPRPPLFEPSPMDFIKDIELPFCRDVGDIVWPRFNNNFRWRGLRVDFGKMLEIAALLAIQELIWKTLMRMLIKACQLVSSAACTLLDLAMPDYDECGEKTGRLSQLIKDSLCGSEATASQVNDTVVDAFAKLGLGTAALSDKEQVLNFANDVSCSSTRQELAEAFLGDPSPEFKAAVAQLVTSEYPDFESALPNEIAVGAFFSNIGNLMPAGFKAQLGDFVAMLPEGDRLPANPSLCATDEQVEEFAEYRCSLLEDRATAEQCKKMAPDHKAQLDELSRALQVPFSPDFPPMTSDPGCDNGIFPFETPAMIKARTSGLNSRLKLLQMDFMTDMMGAGGLFGGWVQKRWGFWNMILSDTYGKPLTSHRRKVANDFGAQTYVDMYVKSAEGEDAPSQGDRFWNTYDEVEDQYGAYPIRLAGWLQSELERVEPVFVSNNELAGSLKTTIDQGRVSDFRFGGIFRGDYTGPQYYNIELEIDFSNEKIYLVEKERKQSPDITLDFRDNNQGQRPDTSWGWGFDLELYLSELAPTRRPKSKTEFARDEFAPWEPTGIIANRPDDNARITIHELTKDSLYKCRWRKVRDRDSEEEYSSDKKYEFLAVDNTFEQVGDIRLDNYPAFKRTFNSKQDYLPQVVLLHEILKNNGANIGKSEVKAFHDLHMSSITNQIRALIAANDAAFKYGTSFDGLSEEDVEYVVDNGQTLSEGGRRYKKARVEDEDGGDRKIKGSDQILGISRMQWEVENGTHRNPGPNRVFYLDPNSYGGSYLNPPFYIASLENDGWLGFFEELFPEYSACNAGTDKSGLIDFGEISEMIDRIYPTIPIDERLEGDADCVLELPYDRILERSAAAGLEGLVAAAARIFSSVHFIKSLATFSTIKPDFSENFSMIYAQYIISRIEESFRGAVDSDFVNTFKDDEFWYAFLEQAVQAYSRKVDRGDIVSPPSHVLAALRTINNMIESFPRLTKEDMKAARKLGDFKDVQTPFDGISALEEYRYKKNLEAIIDTEDEAKIVLQEIVVEQLNLIAKRFTSAMEVMETEVLIDDNGAYFLENLTQGAHELTLDKDIKEEIQGLETEGENIYTPGGELYVFEKLDEDGQFEKGDEYIGYYHITKDDDGDPVYMAGEYHIDSPHDRLNPMGNKIIVPVGDVEDYGFQPIIDENKPFVIEKYISINGAKYTSSKAIEIIKQHDNSLNISDVYPGTLELVTDAGGKVVGLNGELGVRYGLQFSIFVSGEKLPLTTVEVDVLDLPISQIAPLEGDSKMLLCLLNYLKEDSVFKLIYKYIFPLNKINALWAIYNDMGFLASIGEITVSESNAETNSTLSGEGAKPGMWVDIDSDGNPTIGEGADGWASVCNRRKGGLFVLDYDDWDREVLRLSTHRIKRMFKNYYHSRTFTTDLDLDPASDASRIYFANLRNALRGAPGVQFLPWWKRHKLKKANPFDSKGEICKKK